MTARLNDNQLATIPNMGNAQLRVMAARSDAWGVAARAELAKRIAKGNAR